MQIGAMNNPSRDVLDEIAWMAEAGLDFVDLTLEPPEAASWRVDPQAIRAALERSGLGIVGHTAYYLPLGSAIEEIRQAAVLELARCLDIFGLLGARWMNIHPDRRIPMHSREYLTRRNLESLRDVLPAAARSNVGLMIENVPGDYNTAAQLGELLEPLPELGLHLDIGHANLMVEASTVDEILEAYGPRVRHVHLHDNKGGAADLHLPLGAGSLNVQRALRSLRAAGYDGTITLEVFSPDRFYLAYSRDRLRQMWDGIRS